MAQYVAGLSVIFAVDANQLKINTFNFSLKNPNDFLLFFLKSL